MDRAQDGVAFSGKTSNQTDDRRSPRRVQTRSGLVEEKQQIWLGGKFNCDGDALSSLDAKTEAGNTNQSVL